MNSKAPYPYSLYQTRIMIVAILLAGIVVLVSGCDQKVDSKHKPDVSEQDISAPVLPTADRLADKQFLAQINKTSGSIIGVVKELINLDYRPTPIKGEFETSKQYAARRDEIEHRPPYGSKFYALVQDADYSYDADANVVRFFYNSTGVHSTLFLSSDDQGILQVDNLHIDAIGEHPPKWPSIKMSIEEARKLPHRRLRIALVLSFAGLHPPVLSSPNWMYDSDLMNNVMDDLDVSVLLTDESRWNRAYDAFEKITLHLRAHVARVIVFDAAGAGAEHPLFQWTAPQN